MDSELASILWMTLCAALVMLMQGGFCLLESGFCRAKNSINVAIKNLVDFCAASIVFFLFGYALMFGDSCWGVFGQTQFAVSDSPTPWLWAFFLFQLVFCGTATTIISGAIAERVRFSSYLAISLMVSGLFYPLFGHWAWGGTVPGTNPGWLKAIGFIDFAGSTVVHSLGGWVALAAAFVLGPRIGRFSEGSHKMHGHNLPMATFGGMLLWFGWFGFNGGSTLSVSSEIPRILVNTNLSAAMGGLSALILTYLCEKRANVGLVINGSLAGLVGITASCHLVAPWMSLVIGAVSGAVCVGGSYLLVRWKIDDVVGAVPVHGMGGAWGTLSVALFAEPASWGNGHTFWQQFGVQSLGICVCFAWAFGAGSIGLLLLNRLWPLRVSRRAEVRGLNVSEHGESTDLIDLLSDMRKQRRAEEFTTQVHVEPYTEVGQIAEEYNRVLTCVSLEMEAREQATAALRGAEAKYRSIYENAYEGIFQTTADGRYLSANPALARMFGYSSPEELIDTVRDITRQVYINEGRRQEFMLMMEESDAVANFESQIYCRDGKQIWISENARAVRDPQGQLLYFEGSVEDITERKQAESWQRQVELAQAANHAKSEFLAKMSHEIRTPLNGVIGMLDLLVGTEINAAQDRYIRIAQGSADSLLGLINNILDFSKIEAGKLDLEQIEFNLPVLLEDVAELFVHRAKAKGLEMTCRVLPDVPRRVLGDPERIRQIVSNLANNAIKFTSTGEVEIHAETVRISDDGAAIKLSVRDTGIGIPENRRDRLFASFSQVDTSTTRKYGGTGLGLAICKQLVELMGGQIGVDSQIGNGSTFWAILPLPAIEAAATSELAVAPELKQLRVLAVDDIDTNLEILRDQFTNWGISITTVSNATEALECMRTAALQNRAYGLAILDCLMPDMDGLELAEAIRADINLEATPLLMLTSLDDSLNDSLVQRLNLAGYMTKPIRQSRLYDAVVQATRHPQFAGLNERHTISKSAVDSGNFAIHCTANASNGQPNPVSSNGFSVLVTDDNEINQIVACEILQKSGYRCDVASNGMQAIEAIKKRNYDFVLMDCEMPEMDGFEATRAVRRWEAEIAAEVAIPIIAVTANAIEGDRQHCLSVGMTEYVSKPIVRELLLQAIKRILPVKPRGSTSVVAPTATKTPPSALKINELLERCVGDADFATKILRKFEQRVPKDINALRQALQVGDAIQATSFAHALKGAAANVSAPGLSQVAGVLEQQARAGEIDAAKVSLRELEGQLDHFCDALENTLQDLMQ